MEKNKQIGIQNRQLAKEKDSFFLIMNILLLIIFPITSIISEVIIEKESQDWMLIGKWFIFWAVGIRLFTAGIRQSSNPEFTATRIFHMKSAESFVVIRELGFANIALGVMGILSVINNNWRLLAAIIGGIFFGLAGIQHLFKKAESRNEVIAMIYDVTVFAVLLIYVIFTIII
jgi:hypothetical protein